MMEEKAVAGAQGVQPFFKVIGSSQEAVTRTFPMAGKLYITRSAIRGETISFVQSKLALTGRVYQFGQGAFQNVAQAMAWLQCGTRARQRQGKHDLAARDSFSTLFPVAECLELPIIIAHTSSECIEQNGLMNQMDHIGNMPPRGCYIYRKYKGEKASSAW